MDGENPPAEEMMMAMAEENEPMMQKEPSEKPASEKQMSEK
jgi:hypothetical protein